MPKLLRLPQCGVRTGLGLLCLALLSLTACRGTPAEGNANSNVPPEVAKAYQKKRYYKLRSDVLKWQNNATVPLQDLLASPGEFKDSVISRMPVRWNARTDWSVLEDGFQDEESQDAFVEVASPVNPEARALIAVSQIEWNAHSSTYETLAGKNVEITLFIAEQREPDDILGRVLTLRVLDGEYRDGRRDGPWAILDANGNRLEEGNYESGARIGDWVYYWGNGKKHRAGSYRNNLEQGVWTSWFYEGALCKKGSYVEGAQDGVWTHWFQDGQTEREIRFQAGKRQGTFTLYWANGKVREQGNYVADQRDGLWRFYSFSGQKLREGRFIQDQRDGAWTEWNKFGERIEQSRWRNGELIERRRTRSG